MPTPARKVLLTGATGLVGSQLLPILLAAGHSVTAVARHVDVLPPTVRGIEADLLQPKVADAILEAAKPDLVIHLAWTVEHGRFWTDPANRDWVEASLSLLRAAAATGVRRFVSVGTCYEYDWPTVANCDEQRTPLAAHTLYDASKSRMRTEAAGIAAQAGVSFAWGRLFHLYGAHEHPARLVAYVARQLLAGAPAECSSGAAVRDYMDVRDAGAALAALALSDVTGPVNIASGDALRISTLVRRLGDLAQRPDLIRLGARPDAPDEPPRIVAATARLRHEVGFTPAHSLSEGLTHVLDTLRGAARA